MNTFLSKSVALLSFGLGLAASGQDAVPVIQTQLPRTTSPVAMDVAARSGGLANLPSQPEDGYWIDNAPINEVLQYLARSAGLQYFYNNELNGPQYTVTGHLKLDNPREQMEDLAIAYGLNVYQQRSTISLMTETQLARLPLEVMSYPLKYLRGAPLNRSYGNAQGPAGGGAAQGGDQSGGASTAGQSDFEKLKSIIRPMLTPVVGQIEFEEKTNTLLVTDNTLKLERVRKLLVEIDKAKKQIMVNVRVLRIKRNQGRQVGVDWSRSLGENGTSITVRQSLNALFNLPDISTLTRTGNPANPAISMNKVNTEGAGLVFDNTQVQAILRALEDGDLVTQEACPTIITEDNEQGIISIVDRFPVITSDITNTAAGQNITDKVRYKIDTEDPSATEEPEKNREIGVTLSVTPTILPDGTVRMKLRPRVAKIVELIPGRTNNVFPRVSESTVEAISRIPAGQSLFLGGFYDYNNSDGNNKVPILSTIPLFGKLFSSEKKKLEQVSLVFIITPRIYDASSSEEIPEVNWHVRELSAMQPDDIQDTNLLLPAAFDDAKSAGPPPIVPSTRITPKQSWVKKWFGKKTPGNG